MIPASSPASQPANPPRRNQPRNPPEQQKLCALLMANTVENATADGAYVVAISALVVSRCRLCCRARTFAPTAGPGPIPLVGLSTVGTSPLDKKTKTSRNKNNVRKHFETTNSKKNISKQHQFLTTTRNKNNFNSPVFFGVLLGSSGFFWVLLGSSGFFVVLRGYSGISRVVS